MAQVVGLDIGTRTIAGAVFTGSQSRYQLTDFFVEDIPTLEESSLGVAGANGEKPAEVVLPPSIPEVVQRLLVARGLEQADVVAAIDAKDCILREIPVPFTREEHIRKVIVSEAENHFQTFDIEDVILEWHKVDEIGGKSRVLVAAARKSVVRDRLELLKQSSVDPLALDLDAAALFNAFSLTEAGQSDRTTLVIDMGASSTRVLLVEKQRLKKVRSIRMASFLESGARLLPGPQGSGSPGLGSLELGSPGSGSEREARPAIQFPSAASIEARFLEIEGALRRIEPLGTGDGGEGGSMDDEPVAILTDEEYDLIKHGAFEGGIAFEPEIEAVAGPAVAAPPPPVVGPGSPFPPPPQQIDFQDYLKRLGIEIQRTFANSLSVGGGIDQICVTGGLSSREEARRFFRDEFEVEVVEFDFERAFPMAIPVDSRDSLRRVGAVAVGLALKELGADRIGFDFRKKDFRFERKFERVKYPALVAAGLFFVIALQWAFGLYHEYRTYGRRLSELRQTEQTAFEKFFGKKNSSRLLFGQADLQKKEWEKILGMSGQTALPTFIDPIEALEEIARAVSEVGSPRLESWMLKFRTKTQQGRVVPESTSQLVVNPPAAGMGTPIQIAFQKGGKIFDALASETVIGSGTTAKVRLTVTLNPRDSYLNAPRR